MGEVLIEKAKVDLARTTLSLPFDGWVRTSTLLVGEVVRPAKAVARVFPKDAVQVEARLSEADMAALGECAPAAGASEAGAASTTGCRARRCSAMLPRCGPAGICSMSSWSACRRS